MPLESSNVGKVLVVDDQLLYRDTIALMLREDGHEVITLERGGDTLSKAVAWKPDLIVLDVAMPDMDGYEVCEALKANQAVADVPVVFISWNDDTPSVTAGIESGAVDYMSKGMPRNEIVARIASHVRASRQRTQKLLWMERRNRELEVASKSFARELKAITGNSSLSVESIHERLHGLIEKLGQFNSVC